MPRGDKSKYTDKQERKAEHIEESYESRGVPEKEAERRAWATVNKDDGGGKRRAARAADNRPAIPPRIKAAGLAALLRLTDHPQPDRRPPKRPPQPASATPPTRPARTGGKHD